MAEHLTPTGRAAIIVPEGIIFQSQTAYKDLRKMLVENSLVAVVSLPAGVFNPYAGVKTSILILDKSLAKAADTIAFFKVENDGYGLGAQRRAIEKNDLPQVKAELAAYLQALRANTSNETILSLTSTAQIVPKEKIAANGDYTLSGERFREGDQRSSEYPHVELGEVVDILDSLRRPITKSDRKPGPYPYYGATGVLDHVEGFLFDEPLVLVGEDGAKWGAGENSAFPVEGKVWVNNHAHVLRPKRDRLLDRFLIEILNEADLMPFITGVTVPKLNQEKLRSIQIPLPPLEIQKEIVAEIEGYQKVINGARAVLDNYRPHIPIHPDWPMVELGEITKPEYGFTEKAAEQGDARFVRITDISEDGKLRAENPKFITLTKEARESLLSGGDILVARTGATYGKTMIFEEDYPAVFASFLIRLRFPKDRVQPRYYWVFAQSDLYWNQANALMTGGGQPQFNGNALVQVKIPLPPLATQQAIVAEIEAEQALVAANRELITRFEQKIQATLARIWGEEEPVQAIG
jgi:type I restriction enzyme M protein